MLSITIINFVILAVLARLLSPLDFGLMGMVMVAIGFATTIADLGLGAAVIQRQDVTDEQLSTFFFFNIFLGAILCAIVYFSSGLIAAFFKKSALIGLLKIISFSLVIISMGQIFRTLLQKWMDFKSLFKVEISGIIIYGVSSIALAIKGFGVWSLVYGFLVRQAVETGLLWALTAFKPRLVFNLKKIKNLINFGIYVFGERIINYFNRNLDYIIIGRFLGTEALGFYTLAYQLMLFPVSKMSGMVGKVIFPVFSIVQNDNTKLRNGYLKVVKYISLITFPMMAGLFVVAPEFISVIYGTKWQPTVLVLQILCIVGAMQSIGTTVGSVLYSKGRSDIAFKWNCFAICCYAAAFLLGVRRGIVGVATAYTITGLILFPIVQTITNNLIDLKWKPFLKQFTNQFIGGALIILFVFGFKTIMLKEFGFSQIPVLVIAILIGIVVYTAFVFFRGKSSIIEGIEILKIKRKL